jgi:hypothetical protein
MDTQTIIALLGVVFTAIQTLIIVLATKYAISQLKESSRSRQLDAIDKILDYVSSEDARLARKKLHNIQMPVELSQLTDEQKDDIEKVMRSWSRLALLISLNLLTDKERDALLRSYSWTIIRNWQIVKGYVEYQRQKSGRKEQWSEIEELAARATSWRRSKGLLLEDWSKDEQNEQLKRQPIISK